MARVIIDPGHGGTTACGGSSAYGARADGGVVEKHVNLELARRVVSRLGSLAQLTREGDVNLSLRERAELAARSGARALISIHANAGTAGTRGSEIWLHDRHGRGSADLARELHASLERVGPTRGVFEGPIAVLDPAYSGGVAACLVEADYLSDPHGRQRLTEPRAMDQLADAISTGVRNYMARFGDAARASSLGIAHGLPNLTFGPPGPGDRPLGAVVFGATPVQNTPVQIMWIDHNESDTDAGSYWDSVYVVDANGREVFRDRIWIEGLAAGASASHYMAWTPAEPGPVTAYVDLNSGGTFSIPEDRIDDNRSQVSATVAAVRMGRGRATALGSDIVAREVSDSANLTQRYRGDQNIGYVPFYGYMRPRLDFTNRFIWLVWPMRRQPGDPAASIDIDLTIELYDRDPQTDASATRLDLQQRRVTLAEGAKFGYEYTRLPENVDIYLKITFTDYSQDQTAGQILWTNGYG